MPGYRAEPRIPGGQPSWSGWDKFSGSGQDPLIRPIRFPSQSPSGCFEHPGVSSGYPASCGMDGFPRFFFCRQYLQYPFMDTVPAPGFHSCSALIWTYRRCIVETFSPVFFVIRNRNPPVFLMLITKIVFKSPSGFVVSGRFSCRHPLQVFSQQRAPGSCIWRFFILFGQSYPVLNLLQNKLVHTVLFIKRKCQAPGFIWINFSSFIVQASHCSTLQNVFSIMDIHKYFLNKAQPYHFAGKELSTNVRTTDISLGSSGIVILLLLSFILSVRMLIIVLYYYIYDFASRFIFNKQ